MNGGILIPIASGDPRWARFIDELRRADLPTDDLAIDGQRFFVMLHRDRAVAYGGFGLFETEALLCSIVVSPNIRRGGIGRRLVAELLILIGASGAERVWLLTTSAAPFFAHMGFQCQPRSAAPPAIAATAEFSSLCPASAVLMCRSRA